MGINVSNETITNNIEQMRNQMSMSKPEVQEYNEGCRAFLSSVDKDQNGQATVDEMTENITNMYTSLFSDNEALSGKAQELAAAESELYARYAGEDGVLDEFEYSACLQSQEHRALSEQYWELRDANDAQNGDEVRGLGRHDSNNDGNATSGEMLKDDLNRNETLFGDNLSAYQAANEFSMAKAQIFSQYAGDDGILDASEYKEALKSDEYKKALAEYNQLRTFLN